MIMSVNSYPMTVNEWLKAATKKLQKANIGTARLDCLVLIEDCLRTDRAHLLAHPETKLTVEQTNILNEQLAKRSKHIPLAYIRGKTEFYGREFSVSEAVLEPRPETETMVNLALSLPKDALKTIVDVGTGSGAIAITMALELGVVQVVATDIDPACLVIARKNCVTHKATVDVKQADLIDSVTIPPGTSILANLPYVPDHFTVNQAALQEPRLAIFGGPDGLDLYRKLFSQISKQNHKPRYVLCESLPFQHEALTQVAHASGYELQEDVDFIQVFSQPAT